MIDDPSGWRAPRSSSSRRARSSSIPGSSRSIDSFRRVGAHAQDGRRLLLRRPSGFDLHSVREYEQGESLRKVHWRTTARRGQLMVKELEDAPRDEIAVVLDAQASRGRGEELRRAGAGGRLDPPLARPPRKAGGARGQLSSRPSVRVSSLDGDWLVALGLLAAAEPDGTRPVVELLARDGGPASRAVETVVVTATVSGALATKLVQRSLAGQGVSVVWIDAPSFAGPSDAIEPELLRLQAAGVAVAVVRHGDSLAAVLGAAPAPRRAHG